MLDITSANAVVALSVENLFSVNLENFSADSSFTTDTVQAAETRMGVDGHMAAGFTPINLEAGSPSHTYLQLLRQAQEVNLKPYKVQMVVSIPSIGKRYTLANGVLQSYKDMPDGQTVLSPTQWVFHFESMSAEGL